MLERRWLCVLRMLMRWVVRMGVLAVGMRCVRLMCRRRRRNRLRLALRLGL